MPSLARSALAAGVAAVAVLAGATTASAATTARVTGGILEVTGDDKANTVALLYDAGTDSIGVDVGGDGTAEFTFPRATFTAIRVQGNGGSDTLRADAVFGLVDEPITLNGGPGNDTLLGSANADLLKGGAGDDVADGNRSDDTAELGDGNDRFQWDPGDGSDVVDGEEGTDTLLFNGANVNERFDVSANGSRVRFSRDVANVTMDLSGIQRLRLIARGGTDTATFHDLTATKLTEADVDLAGVPGTPSGDGQVDTIEADGTAGADHVRVGREDGHPVIAGLHTHIEALGAEQTMDRMVVHGLAGADTMAGTVGAGGVQSFDFDGGLDSDKLTYIGTNGADTVNIVPVGTGAGASPSFFGPFVAAEPSTELFDVQGLGGPDTVTGQNGLATVTRLEIEGGSGEDVLQGGDGADLVLGGDGADSLDGNRGDDTEFGGNQGDTFQWDPGDSSDVLEGQAGADALRFNGANVNERIDVSANGGRVRLLRDVANVDQDMDDVERLLLPVRGGTDTITVNDLTGTDLTNVAVDLSAVGDSGAGDGAADALFLDGTDGPDTVHVATAGNQVVTTGLPATTTITGSEPNLDALEVETLGGDDTADVAPDVATLINTVVDLGGDEGP
jgi:Ca2+-binding RTX toxin-like protein